MFNKGKFTRLDLCKDGTVYLEFDYKKLFTKVNYKAKSELEDYLSKHFKGLKDVKVTLRDKRIMIFLHIGYFEEEGVLPVLWFEDQEESLSQLCSNY